MLKIDDYIPFSISLHGRIMLDTLNELVAPFGITRSQWAALYFIAENPEINMTRLAELMVVRTSTIVRLVERMVKDLLITKKQLPSDRRNIMLTCTRKGKLIYRKTIPVVKQFEQSLMEGIDPGDLETCRTVFLQMAANAASCRDE